MMEKTLLDKYELHVLDLLKIFHLQAQDFENANDYLKASEVRMMIIRLKSEFDKFRLENEKE